MSNHKIQWYLLILAPIWLFVSLALTASAFYITRDLHSFALGTLTAPPIVILNLLYRRHFPPSAADYEIQKLKLQLKSDQVRNRKRVKP
jgi:hypothetical protein